MSSNNWGMDTDELIIDPSILVSTGADKRASGEFNHYISRSFAELVESSDSYTEDPTFNFFIRNLSADSTLSYEELQSLVDEYEHFSGMQEEYSTEIDYEGVREYFLKEYPPETQGKLADVLFDEFVFLFERSWIASRVKKTEDEVTDVPGLRRFIFDRDEFDAVVNRLPDEYAQKVTSLKNNRKWKWIGLGLTLTGPMVSGPVGSAIFCAGLAEDSLALLFDP